MANNPKVSSPLPDTSHTQASHGPSVCVETPCSSVAGQTSPSRWFLLRKWLGRIASVVFTVAYTLLFLECFIRIFAPALIMPRYVVDAPYGIRVNEPNCSIWHETQEYSINIRTNSKGVRSDREIPYEKPRGTFRIIALGDSFTIGYGVSIEDLWLTQMEKELRANGVNCEVVNLGVSGHSTSEELILLKEEGVKYHPDLVVVGWNGLDLSRNARADLFRLGEAGLIRGSPTYLPGVWISKLLFSFSAYRFLAENSHLYCKIRESASDMVLGLMDVTRRSWLKATQLRQLLSPGQATSGAGHGNETDYEKDLAMAVLDEMGRVSRQNGASLVVLDIPRVVMDGHQQTVVSKFPRCDGFKADIYCPASELSQHPVETTHWTKACGHWTPLGCRIVGRGLAKHILSDSNVRIKQTGAGKSHVTGGSGS